MIKPFFPREAATSVQKVQVSFHHTEVTCAGLIIVIFIAIAVCYCWSSCFCCCHSWCILVFTNRRWVCSVSCSISHFKHCSYSWQHLLEYIYKGALLITTGCPWRNELKDKYCHVESHDRGREDVKCFGQSWWHVFWLKEVLSVLLLSSRYRACKPSWCDCAPPAFQIPTNTRKKRGLKIPHKRTQSM